MSFAPVCDNRQEIDTVWQDWVGGVNYPLTKQMGHVNMQVTLKCYTDWLPDTMAKGGYQTRRDWGAYLGHQSDAVDIIDHDAESELLDGATNIRYLKRR